MNVFEYVPVLAEKPFCQRKRTRRTQDRLNTFSSLDEDEVDQSSMPTKRLKSNDAPPPDSRKTKVAKVKAGIKPSVKDGNDGEQIKGRRRVLSLIDSSAAAVVRAAETSSIPESGPSSQDNSPPIGPAGLHSVLTTAPSTEALIASQGDLTRVSNMFQQVRNALSDNGYCVEMVLLLEKLYANQVNLRQSDARLAAARERSLGLELELALALL